MAFSKIIGASVADDAIDVSDLGTVMSVGETAPASPFVGQRWYRASTAITYQYTNDGTSSFWLDLSSGGIGTSANRGVDIVGDIDPHKAINPSGGVGSVYYNREKNRHFVCSDATSNANVWTGRYAGAGGIVTDYLLSGTYYRIHTFIASGTFHMEDTTSVEYLVVAGGGSGGSDADRSGGGGGAGGFRTATGFSVTKGTYAVTVGRGGTGSVDNIGNDGGNSIFSSITATGGGGGGGAGGHGRAGGSGGGGVHGGGAGGGSTDYGNNGGQGVGESPYSGGGGGGAGAVGVASSAGTCGAGGAGTASTIRDGSTSVTYAGGGGGGATGGTIGAGGAGGGGAGHTTTSAVAGTAYTGGGGGGGGDEGAAGGSGIVIIKYAL